MLEVQRQIYQRISGCHGKSPLKDCKDETHQIQDSAASCCDFNECRALNSDLTKWIVLSPSDLYSYIGRAGYIIAGKTFHIDDYEKAYNITSYKLRLSTEHFGNWNRALM